MLFESYILEQENKKPIAGVTVQILDNKGKPTGKGTTTKANGLFSVDLKRGQALGLSHINFVPKVVPPAQIETGGATNDNTILMKERGAVNLPGVVVTVARRKQSHNARLIKNILVIAVLFILISLLLKK